MYPESICNHLSSERNKVRKILYSAVLLTVHCEDFEYFDYCSAPSQLIKVIQNIINGTQLGIEVSSSVWLNRADSCVSVYDLSLNIANQDSIWGSAERRVFPWKGLLIVFLVPALISIKQHEINVTYHWIMVRMIRQVVCRHGKWWRGSVDRQQVVPRSLLHPPGQGHASLILSSTKLKKTAIISTKLMFNKKIVTRTIHLDTQNF